MSPSSAMVARVGRRSDRRVQRAETGMRESAASAGGKARPYAREALVLQYSAADTPRQNPSCDRDTPFRRQGIRSPPIVSDPASVAAIAGTV
jgi:hypothetical protein